MIRKLGLWIAFATLIGIISACATPSTTLRATPAATGTAKSITAQVIAVTTTPLPLLTPIPPTATRVPPTATPIPATATPLPTNTPAPTATMALLPTETAVPVQRIVSPSQPGCIDINTASREELVQIIHIGEVRADQLIRMRPYSSVDQLTSISGIGARRLQDIKDQGLACVP